MSVVATNTYAALEAHVRGFFTGRTIRTRRWEGARPDRVPADFRVLEIAPEARSGLWTYVSIGTWENEHAGRCSLEFILVGPAQSDRHVELLTMAAYYDRRQHLDLGHLFPLGEPWLKGGSLDAMLVSLPYPFGPALENAWVGEKHVRFLWLLPITQAERAYCKAFGVEALETQFEEKRLEYWVPTRASVVSAPDEH